MRWFVSHSYILLSISCQHVGCWWPDAPGHLQPSWWHRLVGSSWGFSKPNECHDHSIKGISHWLISSWAGWFISVWKRASYVKKFDVISNLCLKITVHRENMPTWLPWPSFHAPLHNFSPVTHRWTRRQQQIHFPATLLIMVTEIRFNFQIYVQCSEKAISKITFNIQWNPKQICIRGTPDYQRVTSKGFENNGV